MAMCARHLQVTLGSLFHHIRNISRQQRAAPALSLCLFRGFSSKMRGPGNGCVDGHGRDTDSDNQGASDLLDVTETWPVSEQKHHGHNFLRRKKHHKAEEPYNYGLSGPGKAFYPRSQTKHSKVKLQGEALFGLHPVLMAVEQRRRQCHCLYIKQTMMTSERPVVRQLLDLAQSSGLEIQPCHPSLLDQLSCGRPHQGVCLDASKRQFQQFSQEEDVKKTEWLNEKRLWVVMDSIQDPMNFGAVLRSSYFMGVDRILAVKKNSCRLSPVASKASAGVLELVDVFGIVDLIGFLETCKQYNWDIIGTTGQRNCPSLPPVNPLREVKLKCNTILLLGNEGQGIESKVEAICSHLITIKPERDLHPHMDSLNVSVATGIILHHLVSSR